MARSYIGALVRINRDITTRGGTKFREGLKMRVYASTSGGLSLRAFKRGWWYGVTGIPKWYVTVIAWPKKDKED